MKRFNKTAIAIALSGAMALGVAPTAGAATPVTLQQGDLVYDKDGNLKTSFSGTDNGMATLEEGDVVYNSKSENVTEDRLNTSVDLNEPTADQTEQGAPQFAGTETDIKKGQEVVDRFGNVVYVADEDGKVYLKYGEEIRTPGQQSTDAPGASSEVDKDKLKKALIGLGATAGVLTIAGIVYKVVKNSKGEPVLVPADRADQTPTAADEAKTDELVAEHGDEIAQQATAGTDAEAGDSAAQTGGERGMGATTGNNSIAQGLLALLVASVMGAAAFAFGRRRLV